jgi:hypothetical protein
MEKYTRFKFQNLRFYKKPQGVKIMPRFLTNPVSLNPHQRIYPLKMKHLSLLTYPHLQLQ